MPVKIRLSRIGKKNAPVYKIVAVDSRKKRDGEYLEDLGTYDPVQGTLVVFHADRVKHWIAQGAVPSDTVTRLHKLHAKAK